MELLINNEKLKIKLSLKEKFFSLKGNMEVNLDDIVSAYSGKPDYHKWALKCPGTYIPKVLAAGTFYTKTGWEFWYFNPKKDCLTIELKNQKYNKMILQTDKSDYLEEMINSYLAG